MFVNVKLALMAGLLVSLLVGLAILKEWRRSQLEEFRIVDDGVAFPYMHRMWVYSDVFHKHLSPTTIPNISGKEWNVKRDASAMGDIK